MSGCARLPTHQAKANRSNLELTERFYCHASDLYDCFVIEGKMMAFTQVGYGCDLLGELWLSKPCT